MIARFLTTLAAGLCVAVPTEAQDIRRLVEAAPDGPVRMSFAARPDVCRNGWQTGRRADDHWEPADHCVDGPVRVHLRKENGSVLDVRAYVGGVWRGNNHGVTDIGMVSARSAADFLLALVRTDPVGHRAMHPAAIADSVEVWPELISLATDSTLSRRINREAMTWLGITAGRFFEDDKSRDDENEARQHALFSVTQLSKDEAIPRLIDVSETHRFQYMRRLALFWLGQSGDSRALAVFQRVYRNRGPRG